MYRLQSQRPEVGDSGVSRAGSFHKWWREKVFQASLPASGSLQPLVCGQPSSCIFPLLSLWGHLSIQASPFYKGLPSYGLRGLPQDPLSSVTSVKTPSPAEVLEVQTQGDTIQPTHWNNNRRAWILPEATQPFIVGEVGAGSSRIRGGICWLTVVGGQVDGHSARG